MPAFVQRIRLETSQGNGVENHRDEEVSTFMLNWTEKYRRQFPRAIPRTDPSASYNCHGLTFASRRTRIETNAGIGRILGDDRYEEITDIAALLPGDIVIYYGDDDGDPTHSGVIVDAGPDVLSPMVCSKWGSAGEFVHRLQDYPPDPYGSNPKYFRCRL